MLQFTFCQTKTTIIMKDFPNRFPAPSDVHFGHLFRHLSLAWVGLFKTQPDSEMFSDSGFIFFIFHVEWMACWTKVMQLLLIF